MNIIKYKKGTSMSDIKVKIVAGFFYYYKAIWNAKKTY